MENKPKATLNPALKLTLYFFIAHYFVEIFYTYLPGTSMPDALVANGTVGIFVVILTVVLQLLTKRSSIWNMCNIFFLAEIGTYMLYFMTEGSALRSFSRFLHGFEQIGYIAAYYLLGCVFKKHGDFRIFKLCLVTILPVSMFSYLIPGLFVSYIPELLPLVATLTSGAVFIVFILMSPAYSKHLFFAEWSDDFYEADMTETGQKNDQSCILEGMELSPRERKLPCCFCNLNPRKILRFYWILLLAPPIFISETSIKNSISASVRNCLPGYLIIPKFPGNNKAGTSKLYFCLPIIIDSC